MAQGTRRLWHAIGAGLMVCSGLAGCMNNEKKPLLPTARGPGLMPSANQRGSQVPGSSTTRTPTTGTMGNTGLPSTTGFQQSGGFQSGPMSPSQPTGTNWSSGGMGNPANTGSIQSPVIPGIQGPGDPLPMNSSAVPSVMPQSSNVSDPGWQQPTSLLASQPVSARGTAPTTSFRASDPPPPELTDPMPPPAPSYGGPISAVTPPTPSVPGPIAPPDRPSH